LEARRRRDTERHNCDDQWDTPADNVSTPTKNTSEGTRMHAVKALTECAPTAGGEKESCICPNEGCECASVVTRFMGVALVVALLWIPAF
jgi:hypothetical protein